VTVFARELDKGKKEKHLGLPWDERQQRGDLNKDDCFDTGKQGRERKKKIYNMQ